MQQDPYFKPSVSINFKQIIIIVVVLGAILSIPLIISFVSNKERESLKESFSKTLAGFKISTDKEVDSPFVLTIPVINTEVDLTILKQNPQLVVYIGLGLVTLSILIGITLIRSLMR